MRFLTIAVMAYVYKVHSLKLCENKHCECRLSDNNVFGEIIDCAYFPIVLENNYTIPNTVYHLDLSNNNISSVKSSNLLVSQSLNTLILSRNRISKIWPESLQLPNLKRLDLSDNQLRHIDNETFKYMKNLDSLNLAKNLFKSFSQLSFHHLSGLSEVILDYNDLGASLEDKNMFDRSGYGLTSKIKYLSISGINLNVVKDNFFVDAYDIRKLVISRNNITAIFELPFTLEYLDLSDNPITEIFGEDLSDLPGLKQLKLNNLLISEVPDFAFASLRSIVSLELERNKNLTQFSELAFGQDVLEDADDFSLEVLSLRGSRLRTLSEKFEIPFGQLRRLDLQGNFWNCDCNLKWIKELRFDLDYEHLRCYTPKPLYNSKIVELNERYFSCPVNKHHVGAMIGVISLCLLLTVVAVWLFVCVPRAHSQSQYLKNVYTPSVGYTMLPINAYMEDRT
ncbi:leucine-rich repeat neuronal protein 3-like [Leptidea sinapis]|uniref:leucine-rich repeat neuronal protein 3-like n=1 Tax=Leptidea sinapis TaxID=189913 RepID=UPI00213B085B|nr:leucine-rich repeat neuronal protein 3-like [Leptidea sinapis]